MENVVKLQTKYGVYEVMILLNVLIVKKGDTYVGWDYLKTMSDACVGLSSMVDHIDDVGFDAWENGKPESIARLIRDALDGNENLDTGDTEEVVKDILEFVLGEDEIWYDGNLYFLEYNENYGHTFIMRDDGEEIHCVGWCWGTLDKDIQRNDIEHFIDMKKEI